MFLKLQTSAKVSLCLVNKQIKRIFKKYPVKKSVVIFLIFLITSSNYFRQIEIFPVAISLLIAAFAPFKMLKICLGLHHKDKPGGFGERKLFV